MLSVLISFIYCSVVLFPLGVGIRSIIGKKYGYKIKGVNSCIFAGLIFATVYAEFFSTIYKVGMLASIGLLLLSVLCYIVYKKDVIDLFKKLKEHSIYEFVFILIMLIVWSYFASRGYFHYDTDLYHAQSIRWIEEYGVVKGLGNLHNRLAYNSALFSMTALFSFKFITGQSLHITNGLLAVLLSTNIWKLFINLIHKDLKISDFVRMASIYYLVMVGNEIGSPASDYALMMIIFIIFIKWMELVEEKEESMEPYALLCVASVFAVSIKLTACVLLILVIKPVEGFIKKKEPGKIIFYLLSGFVSVLPWLIRNVILSGYLIYPFPAIDLFNFDWKINKIDAINDANEIKRWGKYLDGNTADITNNSLIQWAISWFENLKGIEKLLVIGDGFAIIMLLVFLIVSLLKKKLDFDNTVIYATIVASFFFWLLNSPLIRYGYCYVLLLFAASIGLAYEKCKSNKMITYLVILLAVAFVGWKTASLVKKGYDYIHWPNYLKQLDYNDAFAANTYEINGITFYYPIEGDRIGYNKFPASLNEKNIELRGDNLKEGFRIKNE